MSDNDAVAQFAALVQRQARAWQEQDLAAILADYHPDAVFEAPGGLVAQGHTAIGQATLSYFADYHQITARVMVTVADPGGQRGAVEWHWSATHRQTGVREGTPDGIIVELRNGLISRWREYFDTAYDQPEPWAG